jgi:hypothetical protein
MSSTIETTNTNILIKISELQAMLAVYHQYDLDKKDNDVITCLGKELENILNTYETGSIDILSQYYKNKNDIGKKKDIYMNYMKYITNENIIGKLKRIYMNCTKFQNTYSINDKELVDAFSNYEFAPITTHTVEISNKICQCGTEFSIESKNSEFVCHTCGNTEKLLGIVFEDEQFYYQEGQRTKHGKYDPTKHCKFWVDRIQARENTDIPLNVIQGVKKCVKRDNIWLDQLTSPMIRAYLKEIKLTKYNDHVSLIRKIITRVEPEQLSDLELKLVYLHFGRAIQIYNQTKPDNKPNCPYHPFFIYKIIEEILQKPKDEKRKKEILSYIHLQSRETLIENDRIWKPICIKMSFLYRPTDGV